MKQKVILLLPVLFLVGLLTGCMQSSATETGQHLPVSVVEDGPDDVSNLHFSTEDLNGNYGGSLYYTFLKEVTITIDNKTYPLEEAIRDGLITAEELVALAQADARVGNCTETSLTENGLTEFTYTYENHFKMESINDILEAPDGQQHRIRRLAFSPCGVTSDGLPTFLVDNGGPGDYIDKEDWGLTFEVLDVSPTGITIQCQQHGGQQFGDLKIWSYALYSNTSSWYSGGRKNAFTHPITMNGTTTITFDWTEEVSSLAAGSYGIRLRIEDIYNAEDVPPLSRNYHDRQTYDLDFHID